MSRYIWSIGSQSGRRNDLPSERSLAFLQTQCKEAIGAFKRELGIAGTL